VIAEQLGTGFVVTDVEMATVKFYAIATWAEGTLERFADVYGRGSGYVTFTRTPDGRTGISFTRMPPPAKPEVTSTLETPNDNYYRTMAARFHIFDGYGLARYRMVYESEPEASGITRESLYRMAYNSLYAPMMDMPEVGTAPTGYVKVFEKVKGAVIRGRADGAGEVSIACTVETNRGRRFEYGQRVKVENGSFELVVPYAQDTTYPVKPMTPYFLRAGDATREIELADEDLDGRIVTLDLSGGRLHK
jgi:dolichyl-diphosphooligosaccharide--protein glycosyltransferase